MGNATAEKIRFVVKSTCSVNRSFTTQRVVRLVEFSFDRFQTLSILIAETGVSAFLRENGGALLGDSFDVSRDRDSAGLFHVRFPLVLK